MMTHRQRILMAVRGEMPDRIPYAPRIDLWHNANSLNDTLPARHRGRSRDEIALAEGWALHKVVADHLRQPNPDAMLHRALGVHFMREYVAQFVFSDRVRIEVAREGERTRIVYATDRGSIRTSTVYSEQMRRSGTSVPWIEEHAVKSPDDLKVLAHIFENMDVVACYEPFREYQASVGDNGLPVTSFTVAAGPVHHIQKYFLDATAFFHYYRDHLREILFLADALAPLYDKALQITAASPAEVIQWGSNFDEMLTFAPMFAEHFVPWIRKAKEVLGPRGIRILCHTDGENQGLMDLIRDSGTDVAEAVCPAPMTKVTIQEYYRRWGDRITIYGGVPSNLLLPQLTPDDQFETLHGRALRRHRRRPPVRARHRGHDPARRGLRAPGAHRRHGAGEGAPAARGRGLQPGVARRGRCRAPSPAGRAAPARGRPLRGNTEGRPRRRRGRPLRGAFSGCWRPAPRPRTSSTSGWWRPWTASTRPSGTGPSSSPRCWPRPAP